ncbi:MAG: hypothetical protein AB7U85_06720 [Alphaproteobacteria bacterium]
MSKIYLSNLGKADFAKVNNVALSVLPTILARWLPGGVKQGCEWIALNPTRSDKSKGSFKVNIQTGKWADFATGDKGSDVVSLAAYLTNSTQLEALHNLAQMLGVEL